MNWLTIIWSMIASACLTLAAMHLLVWCKDRRAWANLLFALTAVSTAGLAACELWMMQAHTAGEFGLALRWTHVPGWFLIIVLVSFVRLHMRAGRPGLAWAVCGLRTLSLILNFVFTPNLNFREITELRHIPFLGESIAVASGVPNPWMLVGQTSLVLLVIFVTDAAITVWRRGERRQALLLGSAVVFFVLMATGQMVLALWGIVHLPITASLFFMGVVGAMGIELSDGVFHARKLSNEIRETEARMNLTADAAGVGIWMWSSETNQVWGSQRWLGLFGFTSDAPVSFDAVIQRIHPADRQMVENEVRLALAQGVDYTGEYRVVLPDGGHRWVAAMGRMLPDARGAGGRMQGVTIDITARKQSELEIEQQRNELAHLSRVTMLGELSGSLAHELNQPLTAILSNAQAAQRFLASDPTDLGEVREILADIVSEDKRAGEVIRGLRLLLKKGEVQPQPLDVNEVVQEVLKLVRANLVNRSVTPHVILAANLPILQGDRVELQQVLLNLVMNACDAVAGVARADRQFQICTEPAGDDSIRVSVADRGVGIAPDKLEQVFAPFYTTKPHGMGLGLSVCRTIIAAHGGKLWAESRSGQGATFHLVLPVNFGAPKGKEAYELQRN